MHSSSLLSSLRVFVMLILIHLASMDYVIAQADFQGRFLLTFNTTTGSSPEAPLMWNVQSKSGGRRMAIEIEDDMRQKGVKKYVMFNPVDSTWLMLMEIGNIRQGTKIHRAAMYRDTIKEEKSKYLITKEHRIIAGYDCKKCVRISNLYTSDLWITEQLNFDISNGYRLLSHCGMMGEIVRKGDWYNFKNKKGMILEVTSKNKVSGETYTIGVSAVKPNQADEKLFNVNAYKLSDIPEGQNCGPVENAR